MPNQPPSPNDLQQVTITSRAEWRAWLAANHGRKASIWLVTFRKGQGPHLPYGEIVDEALCFGWIDSLPRKLDAARTMLRLSPRRAGSAWSKVNKDKVRELTAAGLMMAPGLAAIERAQADGSWTRLDQVETLEPPADLAAALATVPEAARYFAAFPASSRRGILEWIAQAKTDKTRAKRVAETARLAGDNLKANFPAGRNRGPAVG